MGIYFESLEEFQANGGLKATTITAKQLLPAIVAHMQRMDRQFTLQLNGRLPTSIESLLDEAFGLCHLQQPFYTQHCASRNMRYKLVSKNRLKIDFTLRYRMTRDEEKWVLAQITRILARITNEGMRDMDKILAVHDYIIRAYDYEMNTTGSPFTVYTFMHEKQGVCMAYALLFQKMMEQLGITCYYVVGKADGESDLGHAWNIVELDGAMYHIDVTWNDLGKRVRDHHIRYRYFLRSDDVFKRDHTWNLDHYPPCTSERYASMQSIYDAALYKQYVYYPKKGTAMLTRLHTETLHQEQVFPIRVQQCVTYGAHIYFSHIDEQALYKLSVETNELICVHKQAVRAIHTTEHGIVVTYENGDVEHFEDEVTLEEEQVTVDVVIPLERFGNSWFSTYKGKEATVAFEATDGVRIVIEHVKQLDIDVLLGEGFLQIEVRSKKKNVEQPLTVTIPQSVIAASKFTMNGHLLDIRNDTFIVEQPGTIVFS